jgi:hypothetical protein
MYCIGCKSDAQTLPQILLVHLPFRQTSSKNPSEILFTGGSLAPRIQNRKQYSIPTEVYLVGIAKFSDEEIRISLTISSTIVEKQLHIHKELAGFNRPSF